MFHADIVFLYLIFMFRYLMLDVVDRYVWVLVCFRSMEK